MLRSLVALAMLGALAACAMPNIPISRTFPIAVNRPALARVFLDVNGTLYPDNWHVSVRPELLTKKHALLGAAPETEWPALREAERQKLADIGRLIAGKKRVFILLHGFNANEAEASIAYDLIEQRISANSEDVVVRLYWDGLIGKGAGVVPAWFTAAGSSQVVGVQGLRRILALPKQQHVVVISHSRGSSVVLSALGNPPFAPDYRKKTEALSFAPSTFLNPPELEDRQNRIDALFLAPAIGFVDFHDPSCATRKQLRLPQCFSPSVVDSSSAARPCPDYRAFSTQLKSIHYTINQGDAVLKKGGLKLRRYFNPTDLGVDFDVGRALATCYKGTIAMVPHEITMPHGHDFTDYAQDPELEKMLTAVGAARPKQKDLK